MTQMRGGFDAIIGHRFARKDGISRVVVTNVLRWTIKLTLHENIKDANAPYRLLTKSTLQKALKYIPEKHNLTNVVLSIVLFRIGAKVKFVPVSFKKRETGVNSINLRRIAKIGFRALNDFWKLNKSLPS